MAFFHHHHQHQNHHQATTTSCHCCPPTPPCHHPSPPPLLTPQPSSPCQTTDPFLIASLVAHLLQSQTQTPTPPPNHTYPLPKTHHSPQPHAHPSFLSSLLQRLDTLESSLQHFSTLTSVASPAPVSSTRNHLCLRNVAASVIQTHFRAFLVRRSRTLSQLKCLANIKSNLGCIKSKFSPHGFVDFDSVSSAAMDLLLKLDSIQGEDKMIRDSKKAITREIVQFMEQVDGVCVKRHQILTRKMKSVRLGRNDVGGGKGGGYDGRRNLERGGGSKGRNVDSKEMKLVASLKERVERIGKMSRALEAEEDEDEDEGVGSVGGEGDGVIDQISDYGRLKDGVSFNKNALRADGKKRVCFVEDGDVIRVYNVDGLKRSTSRDMEVIEDAAKDGQDEEEAQSDAEKSSQSSEEVRDHRIDEANSNHHLDEFTFSTGEAPNMGPRADFSTRKPGVKIVG